MATGGNGKRSPADATVRKVPADEPGSCSLLVVGDDTSETHPLPETGVVSIGRGEKSHVRIDDATVSRTHALLRLGETITIEDAGSTNGVFVRGVQAPPGVALPISINEVVNVGEYALIIQRRPHKGRRKGRSPDPSGAPAEPVVVDPRMRRLFELVDRLASGEISVLLQRETGTGKEVVAEALHRRSPRAGSPLVRLSCAALPETMLESELFGYERGAFSGAAQTKPGLLETAQGGTVLLDEIGELPLPLQSKLLRVLEDRRLLRLGGLTTREVDVRVLSATNRNLEAEVAAGRFRADLYYRLNGATIVVPPLRERPSEIEPLAKRFIQGACARAGRRPEPRLAREALQLLRSYGWPGNIRELKNVIERAVLVCGDDTIRPEHLPVEQMRATHVVEDAVRRPAASDLPSADEGARERERIRAVLERCGGNQSRAARELRISRRTLVKRLTKHGLPRPRK